MKKKSLFFVLALSLLLVCGVSNREIVFTEDIKTEAETTVFAGMTESADQSRAEAVLTEPEQMEREEDSGAETAESYPKCVGQSGCLNPTSRRMRM